MDNPGKTSFREEFYFKIERKKLMIEEKEGSVRSKVLCLSRSTFQSFCLTS